MGVTAVTVVKNEAFLIAKHLIHLASISNEVVCFVQPSYDGTEMIAKSMIGKINVPLRVIPHVPKTIVPEDSLNLLPEVASFDWCMYLNADETYVGVKPIELLALVAGTDRKALGFPRWHAVVGDNEHLLKVEEWPIRRRLFHKSMVGDVEFKVHTWSMTQQLAKVCYNVPIELGRIIEYKATWQHYRRQLFWGKSVGAGNDIGLCEKHMNPIDLEIGRLMWKREHDDTFAGETSDTVSD